MTTKNKESISMQRKMKTDRIIMEYFMLTMATIILDLGVYFFKFPNNFSFGGVTGLAILFAKIFAIRASTINFVLNMILVVFGFLFLGKTFGIKTVYVSLLSSLGLSFLDYFIPLKAPLTNQPVLELIYAIVLPAFSAAILFNMNASSGGTDIVAMILKKYTSFNIGVCLLMVDLFITTAACFVFDIKTGLFSFCGLMAKSLVIDGVIENINLCKYFTIVCDNPEPICTYIQQTLKRGATIYNAEGSYAHKNKTIILTVMKRSQAIQLRNFIRKQEPGAFIAITNSSEIIGKGFRGLN